jgi:hypothetical protein
MIEVYIDHNVWHFLFEKQLDLAVELPREKFCVRITREAEFEIQAIPAHMTALKAFIQKTIAKCHIETDSLFGFSDDTLPDNEQRVGGFDKGRWAQREELDFLSGEKPRSGAEPKRKTKLYKNEADASLAARSSHAVVLTFDAKPGPIARALLEGKKVILLTEFERSGKSLSEFVSKRLAHG